MIVFAVGCGGGSSKPDAAGGGPDGGTIDGAPGTPDAAMSMFQYSDAGCLVSAATLCGFSSDGKVCDLAKTCGIDSDTSQCKINCEMGATVSCYKPADVTCLQNAVSSASCTALMACMWIL
jgi:hypothetical protein